MSSHMNFIPNLCSSIRNNAMNVKASTWKGPCLHNHSICVWAWIQTWWPPNQKKKSLKTSGKFGIAEDGILVHPKCIKSKICASKLQEHNERENTLLAQMCVLSDAGERPEFCFRLNILVIKLPLSMRYFNSEGVAFCTCFIFPPCFLWF